MSVNKYSPHLLILPEDDANRQLAVGFSLAFPTRQIQILPPAGGWMDVIKQFKDQFVDYLRKYSDGAVVLLLDFDKDPNRLQTVRADIPAECADRVSVFGVFSKPEALRTALRITYEKIGQDLARECREGIYELWRHELLAHNLQEAQRCRRHLATFIESA